VIRPEHVNERAAVPGDEPFLRLLFFSVREPEFAPAGLPRDQLEALLDQQFSAMRTYYAEALPETLYVILEHAGLPVGYEAVRETDVLHLVDLALLPDYQNHGIGADRVRRLQARAAASGLELTLNVEIFNPAMRLYDRLGFEVIENSGIYHLMRWRPTPDAV